MVDIFISFSDAYTPIGRQLPEKKTYIAFGTAPPWPTAKFLHYILYH